MRKLLIALCLLATAPIYTAAFAADLAVVPRVHAVQPTHGPAHYYADLLPYAVAGYGPFADCNGGRCYIGPPNVTYRRPGQYYYGGYGGYYR